MEEYKRTEGGDAALEAREAVTPPYAEPGAPWDAEAEALWADAIERRARRALAGESAGTDWPRVRDRLLSRIPS